MSLRPLVLGVTIVGLAISGNALARPVSYVGGWTFIETSNRGSSAGLVHYTINPKLSLGARYEWLRDADIRIKSVQPTLLAKRWFGKRYQGNFYLTGGVGVATSAKVTGQGSQLASFGGIMADWETRSFFGSYEMRAIDLGRLGNQTMHAARFGWAPYEGDTGDLHTWIMVEVDRREHLNEKTTVTPLLRFFQGPALLEVGYNISESSPLLNFTYRL